MWKSFKIKVALTLVSKNFNSNQCFFIPSNKMLLYNWEHCVCFANQLASVYMRATPAFNELK